MFPPQLNIFFDFVWEVEVFLSFVCLWSAKASSTYNVFVQVFFGPDIQKTFFSVFGYIVWSSLHFPESQKEILTELFFLLSVNVIILL